MRRSVRGTSSWLVVSNGTWNAAMIAVHVQDVARLSTPVSLPAATPKPSASDRKLPTTSSTVYWPEPAVGTELAEVCVTSTRSSFGLLVVSGTLTAVLVLAVPVAVTSSGVLVSAPEYSPMATRIGCATPPPACTLTVHAPASELG